MPVYADLPNADEQTLWIKRDEIASNAPLSSQKEGYHPVIYHDTSSSVDDWLIVKGTPEGKVAPKLVIGTTTTEWVYYAEGATNGVYKGSPTTVTITHAIYDDDLPAHKAQIKIDSDIAISNLRPLPADARKPTDEEMIECSNAISKAFRETTTLTDEQKTEIVAHETRGNKYITHNRKTRELQTTARNRIDALTDEQLKSFNAQTHAQAVIDDDG